MGITLPTNLSALVIFDRQNQRSLNFMLQTVDHLTSNEQMPSCIVVCVESKEDSRYSETCHRHSHPEGRALENERFLLEELFPLLEDRYRASQFRTVVGHSRYGYFVTSMFLSRINELNAAVALSPFFHQREVNLVDSLSAMERTPLLGHRYYRYGIGDDYPKDFQQMDSALQVLHSPLLDAKGWLFPAAAHNVTPGLTIATALYDVFEYWSAAQGQYLVHNHLNLSELDSLKGAVHAHYGQPLEFSIGVLNGKGWALYNDGQYAQAIEAREQLMLVYPNFSEGYLYILDALHQLKRESLYNSIVASFVQSLNCSNIYSPEEKETLRQELNTWKP